ncbi:hypothetical protein CSAL01_01482 [Colletotrichum salicis]|uniref:Mannosylglycerate hydrolase MGH1-like glycoside hydrolase domain-containing protein n=1 Tax=Colletotrichum salicis TaxID=1209931 RepID=A0A135V8U0_9PEZI|nr:hypothetical protein CSAL01_01482 [Colletotrichum salicis]
MSDAKLQPLYDATARLTDFWMDTRRGGTSRLPFWAHGNDSGWDNSTTFDSTPMIVGPGLAAYLILQAGCLEQVAKRLRRDEESRTWAAMRSFLTNALIEGLWDGDSFLLKNAITGETFKTIALLHFMPLAAARRLPDELIDKMIASIIYKHLTEWGLATEEVASPHYESDGYWRGPIWAPSMHLVESGLRDAGRLELANGISTRFLQLCEKSGFAENFDAVTGEGLRDLSYTWTSAVYLVLRREAVERMDGKDAAQRHEQLHVGPKPGLRGATASSRLLKTCSPCASSHIKCSGNVPYTGYEDESLLSTDPFQQDEEAPAFQNSECHERQLSGFSSNPPSNPNGSRQPLGEGAPIEKQPVGSNLNRETTNSVRAIRRTSQTGIDAGRNVYSSPQDCNIMPWEEATVDQDLLDAQQPTSFQDIAACNNVSAFITYMRDGPSATDDLVLDGSHDTTSHRQLYVNGSGFRESQADRGFQERHATILRRAVPDYDPNLNATWSEVLLEEMNHAKRRPRKPRFTIPDSVYQEIRTRLLPEAQTSCLPERYTADMGILLGQDTFEHLIEQYFDHFHILQPFVDRSLLSIPV